MYAKKVRNYPFLWNYNIWVTQGKKSASYKPVGGFEDENLQLGEWASVKSVQLPREKVRGKQKRARHPSRFYLNCYKHMEAWAQPVLNLWKWICRLSFSNTRLNQLPQERNNLWFSRSFSLGYFSPVGFFAAGCIIHTRQKRHTAYLRYVIFTESASVCLLDYRAQEGLILKLSQISSYQGVDLMKNKTTWTLNSTSPTFQSTLALIPCNSAKALSWWSIANCRLNWPLATTTLCFHPQALSMTPSSSCSHFLGSTDILFTGLFCKYKTTTYALKTTVWLTCFRQLLHPTWTHNSRWTCK